MAYRARLESVCTLTRTGGSNPPLSAILPSLALSSTPIPFFAARSNDTLLRVIVEFNTEKTTIRNHFPTIA